MILIIRYHPFFRMRAAPRERGSSRCPSREEAVVGERRPQPILVLREHPDERQPDIPHSHAEHVHSLLDRHRIGLYEHRLAEGE